MVLVSLDLLFGIGRRGGDRAVGYTGGWFESYELADGGVAGLPRVDPPTWAIKGCSAAIRAGLPSSAPASITTTPPSLPPPPSPNSGSLPLLGCRYPNPSGRFSNASPNVDVVVLAVFGIHPGDSASLLFADMDALRRKKRNERGLLILGREGDPGTSAPEDDEPAGVDSEGDARSNCGVLSRSRRNDNGAMIRV